MPTFNRGHSSSHHQTENSHSATFPSFKKGQKVSFVSPNDNDTCRATIISSAGKKSGPLRNWYNIQYDFPEDMKGTKCSMNFETVKDLTQIDGDIQECRSSNSVLNTEEILEFNHDAFYAAKISELESWKQNSVFKVVPDTGQKCINVRWVCTMKEHDNGTVKPKARLVARGFEENSADIANDSPTCSKDALRIMLSISSHKLWKINSVDIKTAFLQGQKISRVVHLKPPFEANCPNGYVWLLNKCVYGLTDASLHFYDRVKEFMVSNGGKMCQVDPAVFCWYKDSQVIGIIVIHVDDFLWAGDTTFQNSVIVKMRETFLIGKESNTYFQYLGLKLQQTFQGIALDQSKYIHS